MSYVDIGQGLKTRLQTIPSIKQVFAPDELPVVVNDFPTALIVPGEVQYQQTINENAFDASFRVIILMMKASQQEGMAKITPFLDNTSSSATSVRGAIGDDTTLSGSVSAVIVDKALSVGWMNWGGEAYLSLEFQVKTYS